MWHRLATLSGSLVGGAPGDAGVTGARLRLGGAGMVVSPTSAAAAAERWHLDPPQLQVVRGPASPP